MSPFDSAPPEAARREAVQSQRQAAAAWTPEPPALEVRHKSDRPLRNDGARELEIGVAVPLWLPGERGSARDLADAEATVRNSARRLRRRRCRPRPGRCRCAG